MKNVFSILLLSVIMIAFSACQNKITLPDLAFKTDTGYVFDDMTVGQGDTITVGISASAAKKSQILKTFKASKIYDNDTQSLDNFLTETLTSAQESEYTKDIEIIARNQAGTESYTFSILDDEGLENSISLTLTVQ